MSSFSVFKLPAKAAVPQNDLPSREKVFVNYVRVAQRRFGWPYKIIPIAQFSTVSSHCRALEATAVSDAVAHAPSKIRTSVLHIEHDIQLDQKYVERHPEGICVSGRGSLCEPLLYALAWGGLSRSSASAINPVTFDLVPNRVAHITAVYPKQAAAPARTVTVRVVNNLAVWKMTDEPGGITPTIQWLSANGRIIRTIPASI